MSAPMPVEEPYIQSNAWKVFWFNPKTKKKYVRTFEGEKPRESGAIDFGKKLQAHGFVAINIVSKRKSFNKPSKVVVPHGYLWCPYCLKIREFVEKAIRTKDGSKTPRLFRCPICGISIHHAAVRRNNPDMIFILDARARMKRPKLPTEKTIRRTVAQRRR